MNKIWMISLMALFLVGTVVAGISIGVISVDKEIPTEEYDALKTYLSAEDKQNVIESEVKIDVKISDCITFNDKQCKFSAVLKDVIQSYDIVLNTVYCSEFNETLNELNQTDGRCIAYIDYTDAEIRKHQEDYVTKRVEGFSSGLLDVHTPITKPTAGEVIITKEVSVSER